MSICDNSSGKLPYSVSMVQRLLLAFNTSLVPSKDKYILEKENSSVNSILEVSIRPVGKYLLPMVQAKHLSYSLTLHSQRLQEEHLD